MVSSAVSSHQAVSEWREAAVLTRPDSGLNGLLIGFWWNFSPENETEMVGKYEERLEICFNASCREKIWGRWREIVL